MFSTLSHGTFWLFLGLILAGCTGRLGPLWGSAPVPFAPEFYRSPSTTPLSTPLAAVAVYQFKDKRPVADPTVLGEHPLRTGTYGRTVFRATEPVATGVARAFAEGLRARGIQVLDRTMNPLSREREEEPGPSAISGEVLEFSSWSRRTGLVSYVGGAAFHVRVQVYGRQLAEVLWERVYSKTSDAFLINTQLVFLSRSLAESVEDAVNDPMFLEALRRSSSQAPPAKPEACRLLAPQRGLTANGGTPGPKDRIPFGLQSQPQGVIKNRILPELSNPGSHPGRAGGLPRGN